MRCISLFLVAVAFLTSAARSIAEPYAPKIGQRHPNFTLPDIRTGKPVSRELGGLCARWPPRSVSGRRPNRAVVECGIGRGAGAVLRPHGQRDVRGVLAEWPLRRVGQL